MSAMWHATPAHVLQNYQSQIRLLVKMRFLAGIARRTAEVNGTVGMPQVREVLGQLAAEVGMVDGLLHGMEAKGAPWGEYFVPDRALLYSAQVLTQSLYARFIDSLRELAGGGLIMLPASEADLLDAEGAADIARTQASPAAGPFERGAVLQARLGCRRQRVRQPPCAIRKILCRGAVRHARPCVPHVRLGRQCRDGGPGAGADADPCGRKRVPRRWRRNRRALWRSTRRISSSTRSTWQAAGRACRVIRPASSRRS